MAGAYGIRPRVIGGHKVSERFGDFKSMIPLGHANGCSAATMSYISPLAAVVGRYVELVGNGLTCG